ncbi:MAG: hypothetical protein GF364_16950 [Candidatus Lokiarchaeota archaeon]|nr:hypothetical protein [Candidatus Lokiarchaeota archaeon]
MKNEQGEIYSRGSYPDGLHNDIHRKNKLNRKFVYVTYNITRKKYAVTKAKIEKYGNDNYDHFTENCTDFVYKAAENWADVYLPGSDWGIDYPDKLAEEILDKIEKIEKKGGQIKRKGS